MTGVYMEEKKSGRRFIKEFTVEAVWQVTERGHPVMEVTVALDVSNTPAKAWLQRMVYEGLLEKEKRPAGNSVKQKRLLE